MGQVIPLHTEFLSDAETADLEPRARTWGEWATEYGAALAVAGCLVFWLGVAVLALAYPKLVAIGFLSLLGAAVAGAIVSALTWKARK